MPGASQPQLPGPGDECVPDVHGRRHVIEAPGDDDDLQAVLAWLRSKPLRSLMTGAVSDAVEYVLDGARSGRFDLNADSVDSDERASVGTKLQYRIINALDLPKEPPLDTTIEGIPVELKGTVRTTWMIPREGQCQICILTQVDTAHDRFRAYLMRTHRAWLNEGGNQDKKRTIRAEARASYSIPLLDWSPLPRNPLRDLTPEQVAVVFARKVGIKRRLTSLIGFLPEVVIPRLAIETVGTNAKDPMRRARQAKPEIWEQHSLVVLVGTWRPQRELAAPYGFDLTGDAWVGIRPETLGEDFIAAKAMMERTSGLRSSGDEGLDLTSDGTSET